MYLLLKNTLLAHLNLPQVVSILLAESHLGVGYLGALVITVVGAGGWGG